VILLTLALVAAISGGVATGGAVRIKMAAA
jgi:hypothetical protein